jgi:hypothetical protein
MPIYIACDIGRTSLRLTEMSVNWGTLEMERYDPATWFTPARLFVCLH